MLKTPYLTIKRLNNSQPILCPTNNWWEDGVTFNPAVYFLESTPENQSTIQNLLDYKNVNNSLTDKGVVVVHYRARPQKDHKVRIINPSYSGLAIFSPEMELIHRRQDPVIMPDDDKDHYDYLGVEDGRLHYFEGTYYYLYCGVSHWDNPEADWAMKARLCLAKSNDLLKWEKLGPLKGNVNTDKKHNKDGVFFPDKINGHYFLLHRPCIGTDYSTYAMALAVSKNIEGPWTDLGTIKYAPRDDQFAKHVWVGAGAVPIALGNNRYIVIYHRGHFLNSGQRWYDLHAAIFNFNLFDQQNPGRIMEKRLERILIPETSYEKCSVNDDGVANVVFTCGCYEYNNFIYILYGGADCCTLAARVEKNALIEALENSETLC